MPVLDLENDRLTFCRIAAGEEPAFRQLFDRYRSVLYTFVYDFVHDRSDAEEIVQEVFLAVWIKKALLPDVAHPRNYLLTMARNRAFDHLARIARSEQLRQVLWDKIRDGYNPVDENLDAKESASLVRMALHQLSEQKQQIYRMSREENLSHEEIAAATGLSKSRVKNILVEVLKHIRLFLEQHAGMALLLSAWMCL